MHIQQKQWENVDLNLLTR